MLAPIALFAFNRPILLRQTIDALAGNELAAQSHLTIFCDGPRHAEEQKLTDAVRSVAKSTEGFASITVIERERNLGCRLSLVTGLAEMFAQHDCLIIIEDDICCSPYTLAFLNTCLAKYEEEPAVFMVSAHSPPPGLLQIPSSYPYEAYFMPIAEIWGWATWRNRWEKIDWEVTDYSDFAKTPILQQAFTSIHADMATMLKEVVEGRLDTWDIQVEYSRFKHGCVGLCPVNSYVTNTGMGSGTHTTEYTTRWDNDITQALREPCLPEHIFVDEALRQAYRKAMSPPPQPLLFVRVVNRFLRIASGLLRQKRR